MDNVRSHHVIKNKIQDEPKYINVNERSKRESESSIVIWRQKMLKVNSGD